MVELKAFSVANSDHSRIEMIVLKSWEVVLVLQALLQEDFQLAVWTWRHDHEPEDYLSLEAYGERWALGAEEAVVVVYWHYSCSVRDSL